MTFAEEAGGKMEGGRGPAAGEGGGGRKEGGGEAAAAAGRSWGAAPLPPCPRSGGGRAGRSPLCPVPNAEPSPAPPFAFPCRTVPQ